MQGYGVIETGWTRSELMQPTIDLAKSSNTLNKLTFVLLYATDFADRLEKEIIPALKAGFIVLSDRYIYTAMARAGVRGVDRAWIRNLYGFAIAPHLVFYLKIDEKTLIRRVLQSRGMDYWESGMDLKLGDDIYESFRAYQRALLREYASMADEFGFRMLDARRKVDVIQDELRRQIGAFLAENDTASPPSRLEQVQSWRPAGGAIYTKFTHGEIRGKRPPDSVVGLSSMTLLQTLHPAARRPDHALRRHGRPIADVRSTSSNLNFFYGAEARAREHHHPDPDAPGDGLHRSLGLRQEHVPPDPEPDERHHCRHAGRGEGRRSKGGTSTPPGTDVVALRRRVGMVFQKSNPFPEDRSSRTSPTACGSTDWPGAAPSCTSGSRKACGPRPSGTKSRTGCTIRRWRCPAASSSACASPARWRSRRRSC